ncbi:hypothetical protein [Halorientalis halophila]|uniref:hypothetical protein n=1 Tax=Halorientalis halophila TaxID=3108499 RepID=UPI00300ACD6B
MADGDATETGSRTEKIEINRTAYEAYRDTADVQIEGVRRLEGKALETVKVVLLVTLGIVSAWNVFDQLTIDLYVVAAVLSFLYSLWCCIGVYTPSIHPLGLSADAIGEIQRETDLEHHYAELVDTYQEVVEKNREKMQGRTAEFRRGLWAAFAGIALFAASIGRLVTAESSIEPDLGVVLLVLALAYFGYRQ